MASALPGIIDDAVQLTHVFLNLVLNSEQALMHNPAPRELEIASELIGEWIELRIRDSGTGIPPERLKRIFDPFFTSRPGKGTGLGLSVCQAIIQEHGGRIYAESKPGRGATFYIELPLLIREGEPAPEEQPASLLDHKKGLIVDDEVSICHFLTEIFRQLRCHVDEAETAEEAVQKIRENIYDFIVLDVRLPGADAWDVVENLRRNFPAECGRILLITGDVVSSETRELLARPGLSCLLKPFRKEQVVTAMSDLVSRDSMRK